MTDALISDLEYTEMISEMKREFPYHTCCMTALINHNASIEEYNDTSAPTKHGSFERLVLFQFLCNIRFQCQRKLRYWAIVEPLAFYYKGQMEPPKRRCKGTFSSIVTCWKILNKLHSSANQTMQESIRTQPTMTYSLDNYQKTIRKKFQSDGKSANMHNGTVFIAQQDRCYKIPLGSLVRSPSGVLFRVSESRRIDLYSCIVIGKLLFPNQTHPNDQQEDILCIKNGALIPKVGWDVVDLPGIEQCQVVTYLNQHIPAPLHSLVPSTATDNDLLFGDRTFMHWENDAPSIIEYDGRKIELYKNASRFIDQTTFQHYQISQSNVKCLLEMETTDADNNNNEPFELEATPMKLFDVNRYHLLLKRSRRIIDFDNCSKSLGLLPEVGEFINNYASEETQDKIADAIESGQHDKTMIRGVFVRAMDLASTYIRKARMFQNDIVLMHNPDVNHIKRLAFFPLCPRDEVSLKGTLLTHASVSQSLQLIEARGYGYQLHPMAGSRKIFQYGDALTDVNWSKLEHRILRKYTDIGQKEYVNALLTAVRCIIMQHDYFHENMHRADCIYTEYQPMFQPFIALLGVKRVIGDPVKKSFQDHEIFLLRLHKACKQYQKEAFLDVQDLSVFIAGPNESHLDVLLRLESTFNDYCTELESSQDEVSRMMALFVMKMDAYCRCKFGIRKGDSILLEKEGCEWMPMWKVHGKNNYLQATLRRIETLYGTKLSSSERETMRRNRFCRLTPGKGCLANDELCELVNMWLKTMHTTPCFENVCEKSTHLPVLRRCATEIWGDQTCWSTRIPNAGNDYEVISNILRRERVFDTTVGEREYDRNTFWRYVQPEKKIVLTVRDKKKTVVALDDREEELIRRFYKTDSSITFDEPDDEADADDSVAGVTVVSDTGRLDDDALGNCQDEIDGLGLDCNQQWENLNDDERTSLAVEQLRLLGNTKQKKVHPNSLTNTFEVGKLQLKKLRKDREKYLSKRQRKFDLIELAVLYFQKKMERRRIKLTTAIEKLKESNRNYTLKNWESRYHLLRGARKWRVSACDTNIE